MQVECTIGSNPGANFIGIHAMASNTGAAGDTGKREPVRVGTSLIASAHRHVRPMGKCRTPRLCWLIDTYVRWPTEGASYV